MLSEAYRDLRERSRSLSADFSNLQEDAEDPSTMISLSRSNESNLGTRAAEAGHCLVSTIPMVVLSRRSDLLRRLSMEGTCKDNDSAQLQSLYPVTSSSIGTA